MELFTKFNCTNCQDDIPGIRIHCIECVDPYESCLQCFAAGAEIGSHRNHHNYKLMDSGTLSVFRGKNVFSSKEELHLLDAIEQFGYGNWQDISKHIETRSPEDAKEEYLSKFLNGTIGRHTWMPQFENRPVLKDHTKQLACEIPVSAKASGMTDKMPVLDILPEEAQQLGYLPNREDFEVEYDATAEKIVCNLALTQEDDEGEHQLKLAHIRTYTRRLKERARRKKLVRDYQLSAQFFRDGRRANKQSTKDFRDKFRIFAQFYGSLQFERFLYSLEEERNLRHRLAELMRYRNAGVTKIEDGIYWEQQALLQQRGSASQAKTKLPTDRLAFLNQLKSSLGKDDGSAYGSNKVQDSSTSDGTKELGQLQDVAQQTRRHLLLNNETQLCSVTSTSVTNYITLKTVFLSDPNRQPSNDSEKLMKNYLSKCGWLQ